MKNLQDIIDYHEGEISRLLSMNPDIKVEVFYVKEEV